MKFNKKNIYITLFGILYGGVALVSLIHAVSFFALANLLWLAILLAVIFEIGQSAVLFSILTSSTGKSKVMPWTLMCILTAVQILGNVFSSYKYIVSNSPENLRFFKEPVFIWTDIPDAQATVIITYIVGGILPLVALAMSAMVTNYLEDEKEKNEESPKESIINNEEDSLLNRHSILQMENQGLQESLSNKDKELEQLKEELKSKQKLIDLQNQEIDELDKENQELVKEKFDQEPKKDINDEKDKDENTLNPESVMQTNDESQDIDPFEKISDEYKKMIEEQNNGNESKENQLDNERRESLETTDGQTKKPISEDQDSIDEKSIGEENTKSDELVGEDMNDKSGYLIGEKGDPGITDENLKVADALMGGNILSRAKKYSHFINNNSKKINN